MMLFFTQQTLAIISGAVAGIVRSMMGWYDSEEKFNPKLFLYTVVRTAIQGAAFGVGLNQEPISVFFQVYFADSLIVNRGLNKIKDVGANQK
jgi:hypothetical protein